MSAGYLRKIAGTGVAAHLTAVGRQAHVAGRELFFQAMAKCKTLTLIVLLTAWGVAAVGQTVTSLDGISASQLSHPEFAVDPYGAVGTKQYMELVNFYYQAYDKETLIPLWSTPQMGTTPWQNAKLTNCYDISGDGVVIFDRIASRWVIGAHTAVANNYYYCIAVSNTDDLSSASLQWYAYAIPLSSILGTNSHGNVYFPDWPKLGTWPDAYYVTFDLNDPNNSYQEVGIVVCALDRTDMLTGAAAKTPQCFKETSPLSSGVYLGHSLIPADFEGSVLPPAGREEYLVSIQNPPVDGVSTTSDVVNLWTFHVDWTTPANSTFTQSSLDVPTYTPGCYDVSSPIQTVCVPEPSTGVTGQFIDSVGDRLMPRLAYRNFGTYESFLFSHDVQVGTDGDRQTGARWYELRGSGTPALFQSGTVSPDSLYRFVPSIDQDQDGNAAVGYSIGDSSTHPGIEAAWFSLTNPSGPSTLSIYSGAGDQENTWHWGSYTSMTVDPVDNCTFWYVNEYLPANQTGSQTNWYTRIANFRIPSCGSSGIELSTNAINFGNQAEGTTSQAMPVTVTNTGTAAVSISNITITGTNKTDFAQSNNCPSSLGSEQSCTINATFTPLATGSLSASVSITDNAPGSPQLVSLSGVGTLPVLLSQTNMSFGTVVIGASNTAPPVTLTNNQNVTLTSLSIAASGPYSQTNTCGTSLVAGAHCTISVTFTPTAPGSQQGAVTVTDSAITSPQSISLHGSGIVAATLTPQTLNFGNQTVGTKSQPMIATLTNNQKVALEITKISISGLNVGDFAETNNCGSSVPAGGNCAISVTFTPTAKGTRTSALAVKDNAPNTPQLAKLTGTGQ